MKIILIISIIVLVGVAGYVVYLGIADNSTVPSAASNAQEEKLIIVDEVVGTGAEAVAGKKVTVEYTGTFTDGKKFDSSKDHREPFSFTLGAGEVIKGWDEGVLGMKIGGKRKLTVPPGFAYGDRVMGVIPANATLIFDIELLKVAY